MNISELNKKIENIRPLLIKTFTEFYGENNIERIREVINNITFVYISKDKNKYLGSSNDTRINSDPTLCDKISKLKNVAGACFQHTQPPVIAISVDNQIIANYLIHEVNHALHNKEIKDSNIQFSNTIISSFFRKFQEGITNTDFVFEDSLKNLVYEIINEFMTKEILEIFRKNNNDDIIDCEDKMHEYISIDNVCGNIVKKIYSRIKDFIKEKLVNADGQKIRDAIGKNNYKELNIILEKLFISYNEFIIKYKIKNKDLMLDSRTENILLEKEFANWFYSNNGIEISNLLKNLDASISNSFDEYNWTTDVTMYLK